MKRGDTIIEVIFAITVFSMVSVLTLALMNRGLATTTASLQLTLARQEMDAQAEALRFIHSGAESEVNMAPSEQKYTDLWNAVTANTIISNSATNFADLANGTECVMPASRRFALNTREIDPDNVFGTQTARGTVITNTNMFFETSVFPRIVYRTETSNAPESGTDTNILGNRDTNRVQRVEGIWVEAVRSTTATAFPVVDFHIRACWNSPGQVVVTTLGTIVRVRDI
jgi:type II secretory pathway pseudopilin PulG